MYRIYLYALLFNLILFCPLLSKDNAGAEYRTKTAYVYGRFEVNYKAMPLEGTLSTFFTYHEISAVSQWNEIDIEILGRYDNSVQFNVISPGQANHVRAQPVKFNPHADFHTYAFEWTPDYVAWFIDGVEVYRQTDAHIADLNRPQKIMMNLWNPEFTNWVGQIDPFNLPAFAYYDWTSYYVYKPGEGNYGTDNNFELLWHDDFDEFDQERWEKATHSFTGNRTTFYQENAVFADGKLVLCLTQNNGKGFVDTNPPNLNWVRAQKDGNVLVNFTEYVERSGAETISNYLIGGVDVINAELMGDQKSVLLTCDNLDLNASYTLIIFGGISDVADPPNFTGARAKIIHMPDYPELPVKINIGSNDTYLDYLPDQEYAENKYYGYFDGGVESVDSDTDILGTEEDVLYRQGKWGVVKYLVNVPNGSYTVKLLFCEINVDSPDKRVFDIYINEDLLLNDLDLAKEAGKLTAVEKVFENVVVTDETIDIGFAAEKNYAVVSGIIIEPSDPTSLLENLNSPLDFRLEQNYPNPFNGQTTIKFRLSDDSNVQFSVYNILGEQIYQKELGNRKQGSHSILWNAASEAGELVNSGIYLYRLQTETSSDIKKFVYLK